MMTRLIAIRDVVQRYAQVFAMAWKERRAMVPVKREPDELAFLPAHLELMDTPVSPAPHWSMRLIILLFALALVWACFGHLDIVAVAPGQVVSKGRTKFIQPLEKAVVRNIFVHGGQLVHKGDLLMELDGLGVSAELGKARQALVNAQMTDLRTTAVLDAIAHHTAPELADAPGLPADRLEAAKTLAMSAYKTFKTRRQALKNSIKEKKAALNTIESTIPNLKRYTDISHDLVTKYDKLVDKNYVSRQEFMLRQQEFIQAQTKLKTQRHRKTELEASLAAAKTELAATVAEIRNTLLDQRRQAREQIKQSRLDLKRAKQRQTLMQIRSPVTGTVQQLAIHTVGGVVTPAEALMAIVPQKARFEVHAMISNKDIGFVKPGQDVTVKLTSFPYTRYGYLTGTVQSVSHDAVQDKQLGLVFPAVIKLNGDTLYIDGTPVRITAGMSVSAEIKTGQRRVIDYLLSPLEVHVDEAMRER